VSLEFISMLIIQILTAGIFIGGLIASIKGIEKQIERLELKQDKHNCLIERMVKVEESAKSAHHRLDEWVVKSI
jgi:hypothetical protein